jgi:hypothetical protein
MYKLTIRQGETERIHEFESAELAQLYRDYHLAFGHWNGLSHWAHEKDITPENQRFIIDERSELLNGEIVRFFKLTDGIELVIEEVFGNAVQECWKLLREKRNRLLKATDWTQLSDTELSTDERKEYRNYRNYLRVLPKLYDDSSIVNGKVYDFENWKKGKR